MKNIRELSDSLNISKTAIYNKLKHQLKEELKGHTFKLDNVTHFDDVGEQILVDSLNQDRQEVLQGMLNENTSAIADEQPTPFQPLFQPVFQLQTLELTQVLREQIKIKDFQIEALNKHISQLINQLESNQILLQNSSLHTHEEATITKAPVRRKTFLDKLLGK